MAVLEEIEEEHSKVIRQRTVFIRVGFALFMVGAAMAIAVLTLSAAGAVVLTAVGQNLAAH